MYDIIHTAKRVFGGGWRLRPRITTNKCECHHRKFSAKQREHLFFGSPGRLARTRTRAARQNALRRTYAHNSSIFSRSSLRGYLASMHKGGCEVGRHACVHACPLPVILITRN